MAFTRIIYTKFQIKKGKKIKKDFKNSLHDYFIDKTSGRLKIRFNQSNVKGNQYEEYYIPYQFEKNQVITRLHERTIHKGQNSLYELIKQENFWWCGIYEDVKE